MAVLHAVETYDPDRLEVEAIRQALRSAVDPGFAMRLYVKVSGVAARGSNFQRRKKAFFKPLSRSSRRGHRHM